MTSEKGAVFVVGCEEMFPVIPRNIIGRGQAPPLQQVCANRSRRDRPCARPGYGLRSGGRGQAPLRVVAFLLLLLPALPAAAESWEAYADDPGPAPETNAQKSDEQKEQEAKELFEKGNRDLERAARARGKQKEQLLQSALGSYFECLKLVHNPNLVFNLALALEQIGRFGEAFDQYTDYLLFPELSEQERAEASTRREGLRPKVAVVSVHSDTPGATVRVDGSEAAPAGTPLVERAVDEGEHQVAVNRPEYEPFEASVVARIGDTTRLRVELQPVPIEPPEPPETEPLAAEEEPEPVTATVRSDVAATVTVDGKNAGSGTEVKLKLEPGPHVVSVHAPGYRPARMTLLGKPGEQKQLRAVLAPEAEPGRRLAPWPTVAWVATGVAGAVWIGLGARALSLDGEYEVNPTEEGADEVDRANLAADLALVMTGAFAATAVVLTLLDGPREQAPSRLSLEIGALRGGVGLATRGVIGGL